MPKKLAEEHNLNVINFEHKRLVPPEHLTERETQIFRDIVDSADPRHFRKSELPLLCSYVTAVNLSQWHAHKINAGEGDHHRAWLDCTKLLALLASRLRLAPSTRLDKKTVERHSERGDDDALWERY
jgi:phage terminase small subunit